MTVEVFAPAKINLTLHITGQQADGFHLLDSLVVFVDVGDRVSVDAAHPLSLSIVGPFASDLPDSGENLVIGAANLFPDHSGARISLEKNLPIASGIGGGSSDAAAALLALSRLWNVPLPDAGAILRLGADVPVCLMGKSVRMEGIGENLTNVDLPDLHLLLVNPGTNVATSAVFSELGNRNNRPMQAMPSTSVSAEEFVVWLAGQRNDLQEPACRVAPEINKTLNTIGAQNGCLLARMSGSGATCFGVFETSKAAQCGADAIAKSHPDWWVRSAKTLS